MRKMRYRILGCGIFIIGFITLFIFMGFTYYVPAGVFLMIVGYNLIIVRGEK